MCCGCFCVLLIMPLCILLPVNLELAAKLDARRWSINGNLTDVVIADEMGVSLNTALLVFIIILTLLGLVYCGKLYHPLFELYYYPVPVSKPPLYVPMSTRTRVRLNARLYQPCAETVCVRVHRQQGG